MTKLRIQQDTEHIDGVHGPGPPGIILVGGPDIELIVELEEIVFRPDPPEPMIAHHDDNGAGIVVYQSVDGRNKHPVCVFNIVHVAETPVNRIILFYFRNELSEIDIIPS